MQILRLKNDEATEQNVLKVIKHIKDVEIQNGLTETEVVNKYTHGYCSSLLEMVKYFLPNVKPVLFWSCEEFAHFCVGVEHVNNISYKDLCYYDINGKKSYDEMLSWLVKEFDGSIEGIFVKEQDVSRSNEIKNEVYNTICIENENIDVARV